MTGPYSPIYPGFFSQYDYTWEDIDLEIYSKLLQEEGYEPSQIAQEMSFLKTKGFEKAPFHVFEEALEGAKSSHRTFP